MRIRSLFVPTLSLLGLALGCSDPVSVVTVKGEITAQDVDFGRVQVGIRMPYTLKIENVGTGAISVTAIEVGPEFSVADYEFKIADAKGFTLTTKAARDLELSFQPYVEQEAPVESFLKLVTDAKDDAGAFVTYTVRVRGQGIRSGLVVTPNPVDFGTVLVGRPMPKEMTVNIKNTLSVPVDVITRLDERGRPRIVNQTGVGRFEIVSDFQPNGSLLPAGQQLAPDASIDVVARYIPDPSQEGTEDRGKWTIANCEDAVCDVQVTMIGKGTNSAIACMPAPIEFGDVNPGVTATQRTTCSNVADDTVTVTGWRLDSGSAREFSVVPYNGTPSLLEAGASFVVETQFSPALGSVGQVLMGNLVITGRNAGAGRDLTPARIGISGRAGGPDISVLPAELNFGQVAVGTQSKKRIIIENTGYSDLTVTQINPDADGTNQYAVDRTTFSVPRAGTVIIEVTFTPSATGQIESRLIIDSDDTDERTVVVPLHGSGVELPPCQYTVQPTAVNFGIVQVLRSSVQGVRIQNTGPAACLVNDVEVKAGSSTAYTLPNGNETGLMIPPGGEHTILVQFIPPGEGVMNGDLGFYISNPANSNPTVALRGVGSASALLISPNEINFGKIGLDCSTRERVITIYNTGANVTRILRIERPAGVTAEFEILANSIPAGIPSPPNAGAPIQPGQSIEFSVRYHAADIGQDSGFLHVFEQNRTDPYVIPLFGEGSQDPVNEDRFQQLDTPQVDVLWMIDNSCSMSEEQAALTGNFASFIQFADAQALDYRLAVVTSDVDGFGSTGVTCPAMPVAQRPAGTPQGACGFFADGNDMGQMNPDWRLVTPDEQPSAEAAFTAIASQGINGSGDEKGLESVYQALSAPAITGWNAGFLRPDAYLAIIFLSDEEDHSTGTVDFYVNFFKAIKGFRNTNLFSASVIVGDEGGCNGAGGSAEGGRRYIEVANQTGGIFESICTASWSNSLQNLGLNVFGYKSRFFLSNTPIAGSVRVFVDGVEVAQQAMSGQVRWAYDGTINAVNFAPLAIPEPGSEIVVQYVAECL